MNQIELNAALQFSDCCIKVTLLSDLFHNCLTPIPHYHCHPKYELHYIANGKCMLKGNGKTLECPEHAFVIIPPQYLHAIHPVGSQTITYTFPFSLEPGDSKNPIAQAMRFDEPQVIPDLWEGGHRLNCIRDELAARRPAYDAKIQGELMILLADITRALSSNAVSMPIQPDENRAEQIEAFLMEHCRLPDCTCQTLADKLHLSTRQVQRLCQKYFHASFHELHNQVRMDMAAHLLKTTDISVNALAAQLGYASVASFSAAYKRKFKHAPTKSRFV